MTAPTTSRSDEGHVGMACLALIGLVIGGSGDATREPFSSMENLQKAWASKEYKEI
jgi:hypothetical protein